MLDRRAAELVLISLLAAFCGGLAWALDHELFAVAFAAAAVTGAFGVVATLMAPADHDAPFVAPLLSRSLSLTPRRARPPATTRAIQLAHIGIDQSPMMTVHSMKIRTRWNRATTAKITPATRANVFASMSRHPKL